jgi:hypothetical protein
MGLIVLRTDWDLLTCSYIPDPMISPRTHGPWVSLAGRPACAWCVLLGDLIARVMVVRRATARAGRHRTSRPERRCTSRWSTAEAAAAAAAVAGPPPPPPHTHLARMQRGGANRLALCAIVCWYLGTARLYCRRRSLVAAACVRRARLRLHRLFHAVLQLVEGRERALAQPVELLLHIHSATPPPPRRDGCQPPPRARGVSQAFGGIITSKRHYCNIIEAPWLVHCGHGASIRHHGGSQSPRTRRMSTSSVWARASSSSRRRVTTSFMRRWAWRQAR